jgi:hypothetical protein
MLLLARGYFYPEDEGDMFSETLLFTGSAWGHIPEDYTLHGLVVRNFL